MIANSKAWWERPGLGYDNGELCLRGTPLRDLLRSFGTPCYVYDRDRIRENAETIRRAMDQIPGAALYYAIKANRHPLVVEALRPYLSGIDAASPAEVELAFSWGFSNVSFTGTSLSPRDLTDVRPFSSFGLTVTCDNLGLLESVPSEFALGVRFNAGIGAASCDQWKMGDTKPTKFGLHQTHWSAAMEILSRRGLKLRQLHHHIGSGWLREGTGRLGEATRLVLEFFDDNAKPLPPTINMGGGVGVPLEDGQVALNYDEHFATIAALLGRRFETVIFEPGDALVKDAGLLLVTVTYVEDRAGIRFVGVDAGFNVLCLPAHYGLSNQISALRLGCTMTEAIVVGNLCEAGDVFAPRAILPDNVRPGEPLVVLNCGGYGHSMSSHHCGRPPAKEVVTP